MHDHEVTTHGWRRGRVLLAEDDLEMRRMLAWSLDHAGYEVRECVDGTTLLRALDGEGRRSGDDGYDLVISDIRMPGYTGLEVLDSVRAFDDCPPVLLISAFAHQGTVDQAEALGAVTLLPKPFDVDDLLARVQRLMPATAAPRPDVVDHEPAAELPFPVVTEFRHTDSLPPVEDFVRQLAGKLDRHGGDVRRCRVVIDALSDANARHHAHVVKVQIQTRGGGSFAVERRSQPDRAGDNLYLALQMAFAAALKQIQKSRARHRGRPARRAQAAPLDELRS